VTTDELTGWAEMYDGYGVVAREAALVVDALEALVHVGVPAVNVPEVLTDLLRRAERIHAIAAAERERWA